MTVQNLLLSQDEKRVLDLLVRRKGMSFLRIAAVANLPVERLERIVEDFEHEGFVFVNHRDDELRRTVMLEPSALSRLPDLR